jgi:DhnA family fructose-bisphosphate aldolase class Ia
MDGREIRLERLFGDGRAVVIAIDHGMFDGPLPAMEDLRATAEHINPIVDAVLVAPGMMRHCGKVFARPKRPLAMARLNWNTIYCRKLGYTVGRSSYAYTVEDALREGVDLASVSLTLHGDDPDRDAANIEVFSRLTTACHAMGVPVVAEYFPAGHNRMDRQQLHNNVVLGTRIAAELGADAVKTLYTHDFKTITATCPVPVLGLGAEKLPTQEAGLRLAAREIQEGARGVVFGRNAIQVPDPFRFQSALCDVVKTGMLVEEAVRLYELLDR